ncbi:MAG: serine/threonine protein kinase, partial [Planctomycetota bacterium]|nr:serine/threonine protein kinase [Planctomycetota bacterium]
MTQGNDGSSLPTIEGLRIICELGRSPRGITYKARRLLEQDIVAVKVFNDGLSRNAEFRERLDRNAGLAFLLEHRAMVRTLGVFQDGDRLCLMMEYAPGEPLTRALQRNVRFGPERAVAIAMRIGSALSYAWRHGYVHGRLHPSDVIVTADQVSVLGIALGEKVEVPPPGTPIADEVGRFNPLIYAAPELLKGAGPPAGAEYLCDLYSLGAILHHMLTGLPPFRTSAIEAFVRKGVQPALVWPRDMEDKLPRNAVVLVERLVRSDPAARGSFETLADGLQAALQEIRGIRPCVQAWAPEPPPVLPPVEPLPARPAAQPAAAPGGEAPVDSARASFAAGGEGAEASWRPPPMAGPVRRPLAVDAGALRPVSYT